MDTVFTRGRPGTDTSREGHCVHVWTSRDGYEPFRTMCSHVDVPGRIRAVTDTITSRDGYCVYTWTSRDGYEPWWTLCPHLPSRHGYEPCSARLRRVNECGSHSIARHLTSFLRDRKFSKHEICKAESWQHCHFELAFRYANSTRTESFLDMTGIYWKFWYDIAILRPTFWPRKSECHVVNERETFQPSYRQYECKKPVYLIHFWRRPK